MMRSLSSCLDATRMWRSTERVSLEKKPSMRLSQEPWVGVKVNSKRWAGCCAIQAAVSLPEGVTTGATGGAAAKRMAGHRTARLESTNAVLDVVSALIVRILGIIFQYQKFESGS